MNKHKEITLSKFISKILRHEPKQFGLERDVDNFVDLNGLIEVVVNEFYNPITNADVRHILATSEKDGIKRFQIVGDKVRATYKITKRNEE